MPARRLLSLIACLSVVVLGAILSGASAVSGAAPGAPHQGDILGVRHFACGDCPSSVSAPNDQTVWAGTASAGVIRHDLSQDTAQQFTVEHGLPGRSIWRLVANSDGHVWAVTRSSSAIGPETGLAHYDGQSWTTHLTADGASTIFPRDMAPGTGAEVWLASADGIGYFDGTTWRTYTSADGLPSTNASAVAPDGPDVTYAATDAGPAVFDGTTWQALPQDGLPPTQIKDMIVAPDGVLWAAMEAGPSRFRPGGWPGGTSWESFGMDSAQVWAQADGTITVAAFGENSTISSVHHFDGNSWSPDNRLLANVGGEQPLFLDVSPGGHMFIVSAEQGVGHLRPAGSWDVVTSDIGPTTLVPFSVDVADNGHVWAGFFRLFDRSLVNRFDGDTWHPIGPRDGFLAGTDAVMGVTMRALDIGDDGLVWVGVHEVGVAAHDGIGWSTHRIEEFWPPGDIEIAGVTADDRGGVWLATEGAIHGRGAGAFHYDGVDWRRISTADGLPSDDVYDVALDRRGGHESVWFATGEGLAHLDAGVMTVYRKVDGLATDSVASVAVDYGRDMVWAVSDDPKAAGLSQFSNGQWTILNASGGPPVWSAWSVQVDPYGDIWLPLTDNSSDDLGLARFDGRQWHRYTEADGLNNNVVFDVGFDPDGDVWVASLTGIVELDLDRQPLARTPSPTAPSTCVCDFLQGRVPSAEINRALANPDRFAGWGMPRDPGKPVGPFNPSRECLSIRSPGVAYHPTFNALVWQSGCP